ncbi:uro-adherence factor A-like [Periplaneta americana]|uniref:uro-adherence factor A-like n=1 Tax=Periplaneta americana TaxID=6978 RepID=UPI0037E988DD
MECTQVLDDISFEEPTQFKEGEKKQVGCLEIKGVKHAIYNGENRIGREGSCCAISVCSKALSKEHAVIEVLDPDSHLIYDVGSRNKTRLGKMTLQPKVRYQLFDGAKLYLADVSAVYHRVSDSLGDDSGSETGSESMLTMSTSVVEDTVIVPETPAPTHIKPKSVMTVAESPSSGSDADGSFSIAKPKGSNVMDTKTRTEKEKDTTSESKVKQDDEDNSIFEAETQCDIDISCVDNSSEKKMETAVKPSTSKAAAEAAEQEEDLFEADTQYEEPLFKSPAINDSKKREKEAEDDIHELDTQCDLGDLPNEKTGVGSGSEVKADKEHIDEDNIYDAPTQRFPEQSTVDKTDAVSNCSEQTEEYVYDDGSLSSHEDLDVKKSGEEKTNSLGRDTVTEKNAVSTEDNIVGDITSSGDKSSLDPEEKLKCEKNANKSDSKVAHNSSFNEDMFDRSMLEGDDDFFTFDATQISKSKQVLSKETLEKLNSEDNKKPISTNSEKSKQIEDVPESCTKSSTPVSTDQRPENKTTKVESNNKTPVSTTPTNVGNKSERMLTDSGDETDPEDIFSAESQCMNLKNDNSCSTKSPVTSSNFKTPLLPHNTEDSSRIKSSGNRDIKEEADVDDDIFEAPTQLLGSPDKKNVDCAKLIEPSKKDNSQQISNRSPVVGANKTMASTAEDSNTPDDIFEEPTQIIVRPSKHEDSRSSKKDSEKHERSSEHLNNTTVDNDDIFEAATQVLETPNKSKELKKTSEPLAKDSVPRQSLTSTSCKYDEISEVATQIVKNSTSNKNVKISSKSLESDSGNKQSSTSNANTEKHSTELNTSLECDIFDAPTQIIPLKDEKTSESSPNNAPFTKGKAEEKQKESLSDKTSKDDNDIYDSRKQLAKVSTKTDKECSKPLETSPKEENDHTDIYDAATQLSDVPAETDKKCVKPVESITKKDKGDDNGDNDDMFDAPTQIAEISAKTSKECIKPLKSSEEEEDNSVTHKNTVVQNSSNANNNEKRLSIDSDIVKDQNNISGPKSIEVSKKESTYKNKELISVEHEDIYDMPTQKIDENVSKSSPNENCGKASSKNETEVEHPEQKVNVSIVKSCTVGNGDVDRKKKTDVQETEKLKGNKNISGKDSNNKMEGKLVADSGGETDAEDIFSATTQKVNPSDDKQINEPQAKKLTESTGNNKIDDNETFKEIKCKNIDTVAEIRGDGVQESERKTILNTSSTFRKEIAEPEIISKRTTTVASVSLLPGVKTEQTAPSKSIESTNTGDKNLETAIDKKCDIVISESQIKIPTEENNITRTEDVSLKNSSLLSIKKNNESLSEISSEGTTGKISNITSTSVIQEHAMDKLETAVTLKQQSSDVTVQKLPTEAVVLNATIHVSDIQVDPKTEEDKSLKKLTISAFSTEKECDEKSEHAEVDKSTTSITNVNVGKLRLPESNTTPVTSKEDDGQSDIVEASKISKSGVHKIENSRETGDVGTEENIAEKLSAVESVKVTSGETEVKESDKAENETVHSGEIDDKTLSVIKLKKSTQKIDADNLGMTDLKTTEITKVDSKVNDVEETGMTEPKKMENLTAGTKKGNVELVIDSKKVDKALVSAEEISCEKDGLNKSDKSGAEKSELVELKTSDVTKFVGTETKKTDTTALCYPMADVAKSRLLDSKKTDNSTTTVKKSDVEKPMVTSDNSPASTKREVVIGKKLTELEKAVNVAVCQEARDGSSELVKSKIASKTSVIEKVDIEKSGPAECLQVDTEVVNTAKSKEDNVIEATRVDEKKVVCVTDTQKAGSEESGVADSIKRDSVTSAAKTSIAEAHGIQESDLLKSCKGASKSTDKEKATGKQLNTTATEKESEVKDVKEATTATVELEASKKLSAHSEGKELETGVAESNLSSSSLIGIKQDVAEKCKIKTGETATKSDNIALIAGKETRENSALISSTVGKDMQHKTLESTKVSDAAVSDQEASETKRSVKLDDKTGEVSSMELRRNVNGKECNTQISEVVKSVTADDSGDETDPENLFETTTHEIKVEVSKNESSTVKKSSIPRTAEITAQHTPQIDENIRSASSENTCAIGKHTLSPSPTLLDTSFINTKSNKELTQSAKSETSLPPENLDKISKLSHEENNDKNAILLPSSKSNSESKVADTSNISKDHKHEESKDHSIGLEKNTADSKALEKSKTELGETNTLSPSESTFVHKQPLEVESVKKKGKVDDGRGSGDIDDDDDDNNLNDTMNLIMPSSQDLREAVKESEALKTPYKSLPSEEEETESVSPTMISKRSYLPVRRAKVRKRDLESKFADTNTRERKSPRKPEDSSITNTAIGTSRRRKLAEESENDGKSNNTVRASKQRKLVGEISVANSGSKSVQSGQNETIAKESTSKGGRSKVSPTQKKRSIQNVSFDNTENEIDVKVISESPKKERSSRRRSEQNESKKWNIQSQESSGSRRRQDGESAREVRAAASRSSKREKRSTKKNENAENIPVAISRPSRQRKMTWKVRESLETDSSQGYSSPEEKSKNRTRGRSNNNSPNEINENVELISRSVKSRNSSPTKSPSKKTQKQGIADSPKPEKEIKSTTIVSGSKNLTPHKATRQNKEYTPVSSATDTSESSQPQRTTRQKGAEMVSRGQKRRNEESITEVVPKRSRRDEQVLSVEKLRSSTDKDKDNTRGSRSAVSIEKRLKDVTSEPAPRSSGRKGRQNSDLGLVESSINTSTTENRRKGSATKEATNSVQNSINRNVKKKTEILNSNSSCLNELNNSVVLSASNRSQRGVKRTKASAEDGIEASPAKHAKFEQRQSHPNSPRVDSTVKDSSAQVTGRGRTRGKTAAFQTSEIKTDSTKSDQKVRTRTSKTEDRNNETETPKVTISEKINTTPQRPRSSRGKGTPQNSVQQNVSSGVTTPRRSTPRKLASAADASTYQVLFTGFSDTKQEAIVKQLGGRVVDLPESCTVLVTDKVRRTYKFLCIMGRGKPIVSPEWLVHCRRSECFVDPWQFLIKDKESESKFKFHIQESLQSAAQTPLLSGYSVYVTPKVKPPPAEMKGIIESCGGVSMPSGTIKSWPVKSFIISCIEDKASWSKLKKSGKPIVGPEVLLLGVLQQKLDLKSNTLV